MMTGRDLELFTDRSDIGWGAKWRSTIDDALTETTFFIAIVTPRYVASTECRRELLLFSESAKARGVAELLFPILYIDVDGLDENSEDEVKAAIAQAQYVSFTKLRLVEEHSSEYRTAINEMAQRLMESQTSSHRESTKSVRLYILVRQARRLTNSPASLKQSMTLNSCYQG